MDRLACVDVPALPLQVLEIRHPEWRSLPCAVVSRNTAQGSVLWVNSRARQAGVRVGLRHSAALSIEPDLRVETVLEKEVSTAEEAIRTHLHHWSPGVESHSRQPGIFWVDASGLARLHPSPARWARRLRDSLRRMGFRSTVVVGFRRLGTHVLARTRTGVHVSTSAEEEARNFAACSVEALGLSPKTLRLLEKLGIHTAGQLAALPPDQVKRRFGPEIQALRRLADPHPIAHRPPPPPLRRVMDLEPPETDRTRLVFLLSQLLHPILGDAASRGLAIHRVTLVLDFDRKNAKPSTESIGVGRPTLDATGLLHLVHLRLDSACFPAPVLRITLTADGILATAEQLQLFAQAPRRDLEAAGRALDRIRAELGDRSVVRARLRDGHLPEATFRWVPLTCISLPRPVEGPLPMRTLVRRILQSPLALPPRRGHEPDGWLLDDLAAGPVERHFGPHVVSGGWWQGRVHRDYFFAETRRGDLYWLYFDRRRRRWRIQGTVE